MLYFDILPAELIQEIAYHLNNDDILLTKEIPNFRKVYNDFRFWENKLKSIDNYNLINWKFIPHWFRDYKNKTSFYDSLYTWDIFSQKIYIASNLTKEKSTFDINPYCISNFSILNDFSDIENEMKQTILYRTLSSITGIIQVYNTPKLIQIPQDDSIDENEIRWYVMFKVLGDVSVEAEYSKQEIFNLVLHVLCNAGLTGIKIKLL